MHASSWLCAKGFKGGYRQAIRGIWRLNGPKEKLQEKRKTCESNHRIRSASGQLLEGKVEQKEKNRDLWGATPGDLWKRFKQGN